MRKDREDSICPSVPCGYLLALDDGDFHCCRSMLQNCETARCGTFIDHRSYHGHRIKQTLTFDVFYLVRVVKGSKEMISTKFGQRKGKLPNNKSICVSE